MNASAAAEGAFSTPLSHRIRRWLDRHFSRKAEPLDHYSDARILRAIRLSERVFLLAEGHLMETAPAGSGSVTGRARVLADLALRDLTR